MIPNGNIVGAAKAGSGDVTAVSIASANGFAGSSSGGATPALTLSTTITGVLKGNGSAVSAATAGTDYISPAVTSDLVAGYTETSTSGGTISSGTYTPTPSSSVNNQQYITNGGAFTLGVPASDCTVALLITNNGSAGAITTSGYTKVSGSFDTTNTHAFMCFITVVNAKSLLVIQAMQ